MNRSLKIALIVLALLALGGLSAYALLVRPTKAPTQTADNSTVPLAPKVTPPTTETPVTQGSTSTEGAFRISSEKSKATFTLNEVLRDVPTTVVGVTNQVSGEVQADRMALADARIGMIRINARTFVTDDESRNNAIRRMILKSEEDANEYIEFTPKTITGLPPAAEIGATMTFAVTGDLKIAGVTKPATFNGTVTFTSDTELSGTVESKIHFPDWSISVPDFPFLANVDQDVTLTLDFVATK